MERGGHDNSVVELLLVGILDRNGAVRANGKELRRRDGEGRRVQTCKVVKLGGGSDSDAFRRRVSNDRAKVERFIEEIGEGLVVHGEDGLERRREGNRSSECILTGGSVVGGDDVRAVRSRHGPHLSVGRPRKDFVSALDSVTAKVHRIAQGGKDLGLGNKVRGGRVNSRLGLRKANLANLAQGEAKVSAIRDVLGIGDRRVNWEDGVGKGLAGKGRAIGKDKAIRSDGGLGIVAVGAGGDRAERHDVVGRRNGEVTDDNLAVAFLKRREDGLAMARFRGLEGATANVQGTSGKADENIALADTRAVEAERLTGTAVLAIKRGNHVGVHRHKIGCFHRVEADVGVVADRGAVKDEVRRVVSVRGKGGVVNIKRAVLLVIEKRDEIDAIFADTKDIAIAKVDAGRREDALLELEGRSLADSRQLDDLDVEGVAVKVERLGRDARRHELLVHLLVAQAVAAGHIKVVVRGKVAVEGNLGARAVAVVGGGKVDQVAGLEEEAGRGAAWRGARCVSPTAAAGKKPFARSRLARPASRAERRGRPGSKGILTCRFSPVRSNSISASVT